MHRNRALSNQQMWLPTSDDEYTNANTDMPTSSLVPVFDHVFTPIAADSSPSPSANTDMPTPSLVPAFVHVFTPIAADSSPSPIRAVLQHTTQPILDLMPPGSSHGHTMLCENHVQPFEFCGVDESVEFQEWRLWTAPRRIATIRR